MDQKMLRTSEACAYLSVSRTTFWRWRRKGIVPDGRLVGRVELWLPSELAAALEKYKRQRPRRNPPDA